MEDNQGGDGPSGSVVPSKGKSSRDSCITSSSSGSHSVSYHCRCRSYSQDRDHHHGHHSTRRRHRSYSRSRSHYRRRSSSPRYYRRSHTPRRSLTPRKGHMKKQELVQQVVEVLKPMISTAATQSQPPDQFHSNPDHESSILEIEEVVEPKNTQSSGHLNSLVTKYKKETEADDGDPTTAPIAEQLNPILQHWWWTVPSKEDVKKTLDRCLHPDNCQAIKKVWVNKEVFKKVGQQGRDNCRGITRIHRSPSRPRPAVRPTAVLINIHEHPL